MDSEFKALKSAKKPDEYYVPTRYPNGLPGGVPAKYYDDLKEAGEALASSEKILALVKKLESIACLTSLT